MARPSQRASTQGITNATVTTTAETVAATLTGVSTGGPSETVRLEGSVNITAGTAGATITVRIRRASVTGTTVATEHAVEVTAGNTVEIPIQADDTPGEVGGLAYVLTVAVASATGNSTINNAYLRADY